MRERRRWGSRFSPERAAVEQRWPAEAIETPRAAAISSQDGGA
jgi:hypothetical protein